MKINLFILLLFIATGSNAQTDTTQHNRLSHLLNIESRFPRDIRLEALSDTILKELEYWGSDMIIYMAHTTAKESCNVNNEGVFIYSRGNKLYELQLIRRFERFYVDTLNSFKAIDGHNTFLRRKIASHVAQNLDSIAKSPTLYSETYGNFFVYIKYKNREVYKKYSSIEAGKDHQNNALQQLLNYYYKLKFRYNKNR